MHIAAKHSKLSVASLLWRSLPLVSRFTLCVALPGRGMFTLCRGAAGRASSVGLCDVHGQRTPHSGHMCCDGTGWRKWLWGPAAVGPLSPGATVLLCPFSFLSSPQGPACLPTASSCLFPGALYQLDSRRKGYLLELFLGSSPASSKRTRHIKATSN